MGLSNEERMKGLYHSVSKLNKLADGLNRNRLGYNYPNRLVCMIRKLWHDLLGNSRNSDHWFSGSSATNPVTWGTISPWAIAVSAHCDGLFEEENEIIKSRKNIEQPFDAFEGFLDIPSLLLQTGEHHRFIYESFAWSEQIIYYLRRYNDDLLKTMMSMSRTISLIQGECFQYFKNDDVYAKAYVLSQACRIIYTEKYPYGKIDNLTQYLIKDSIHHYVSRLISEGSLKEIAEVHVALERAKKKGNLTQVLRAESFIKLAGRRYHYDHKFNTFMKMVARSWCNDKKKRITELFEKCKKSHEEHEKRSQQNYRHTQEDNLSLYGLCYE